MKNEIATTILSQLGGRGFLMLTGSKIQTAAPNGITFKLPFNKSKAGYFKVSLNDGDTYDLEFFKVRKFKVFSTEKLTNIYCDQLQDIFEEKTGLFVTLRSRQ